MKLDSLPKEAQPHLARIGDYAAQTVARSAHFALKLHADCVDVEHLLAAILEDEDSAAGQTILHAFADPETILAEVIALCPGILVIGSKRSLPFSVKGVLAMDDTRAIARAEHAASITPGHVVLAAAQQLAPQLMLELEGIGFSKEPSAPDSSLDAVPESGALLKYFNSDARRALSAACRCAVRLKRDAISPAHLIMGALEGQTRGLAGLTSTRAQMLFMERDADLSEPRGRNLPFSTDLIRLLTALPDEASSARLLAWIVDHGSPELQGLLDRQRVTRALLEHTRTAFGDPDPTAG